MEKEKKNFSHVNEFKIRGPIVRIELNDVAVNITLKTPNQNLPSVAKGGPAYCFPEVSFYGVKEEVYKQYKKGDNVEITGMLRQKKRINKETGSEFYDQYMTGETIKLSEKLLMREFGVDEGPAIEGMNLVKVSGIVSAVIPVTEHVTRIKILTFVKGKVNNLQGFLYGNSQKFAETFHRDDQVTAVGTIETAVKEKDDGTRRYRNLVITAIAKAK